MLYDIQTDRQQDLVCTGTWYVLVLKHTDSSTCALEGFKAAREAVISQSSFQLPNRRRQKGGAEGMCGAATSARSSASLLVASVEFSHNTYPHGVLCSPGIRILSMLAYSADNRTDGPPDAVKEGSGKSGQDEHHPTPHRAGNVNSESPLILASPTGAQRSL